MGRHLVLAFALSLLLFPAASLEGARRGLGIWAHVLLPSLFPATVAAVLLVRLGFLDPAGRILEPLMRPLFGLPGSTGPALAMSASSGYLMGAILAGELRRAGLLTRREAERFLALATFANPLFLSGAVAVGMFGVPELGGLFLASHYLGALGVGLLFRFFPGGPGGGNGWVVPAPGESALPLPLPVGDGGGEIPAGAAVGRGGGNGIPVGAAGGGEGPAWRRESGSPAVGGNTRGSRCVEAWAGLLREAVESAIRALLLAGGVIAVFSSFLAVLEASGGGRWLGEGASSALRLLGFDPRIGEALWQGIFEVTLGAEALAGTPAPLLQRAVLAGALAGWGGLSVLFQVAALVQGTDISLRPYLGARALHALLSGGILLLLFASRPG